jgi:aspartyl-tRNA(Asn)/glutamyl-tRNA(Gln) amidotransferase subunit A
LRVVKSVQVRLITKTASQTESIPAFASIAEVARLFRAGKLSPVQLTDLMLERIERFNPRLNAFITVAAEYARAQAKKAEAELSVTRRRKTAVDLGPLHGIPISLKDNICTAGIRTTAGSAVLRDLIPREDAPVVTRLKQGGAVILGKTNMHEFAYGVTTNNPHYLAARNPWDVSKISGGSSGGSAVALAAGLCFGSIGTDTGGSIRIPAALCGVTGLKPTRDRIDARRVIPLSPTLDCVGPMARTAGDASTLFGAILGHEGQSRAAGRKATFRNLSKLRLGVPREFFFDVISVIVEKLFQSALLSLRRLGAKIVDVSIPLLLETESAGNRIGWAEATHYHQQSGWFPARATEYSEDVRSRLEAGTKVSATAYLEALDQRQKFIHQLRAVMEAAKLDALVVPTVPIEAPAIGEENIRIGATEYPTRALLLRLNRPANLAGVPAISVPCGFTPEGLPIGLQFIGNANGEDTLLSIAKAYERLNPSNQHPNS